MALLIITCLVLSLTSNLVPVFNVMAILALVPLRLFCTERAADPDLVPRRAINCLLLAYTFWIASYLLTGASISNLFSYDFLRYDGARFVGYLPLLLMGACGLKSNTVTRLLWIYLGILAVAATLGAVQFITHIEGLNYDAESTGPHWNVLYKSELTTDIFHGWYRAHNAAGSVYAMATCVALAFFLGRNKTKALSWQGLIFAAVLTGLVLAQSRSGYVAFTAASVIVFMRKKEHARRLLRLGIVVGVPLLMFWLSQSLILRRVQWITNFEEPNAAGRLINYADALTDFARSPLIGIGLGRYNDEWKIYSEIPPVVSVATQGEVVNLDNHAHNSYLHFLAEGGIVGLALMLGVWIETYRWAGMIRRRFGELSATGTLAQGIQASIVVVCFFSLTEHAMGMASSPLVIFTMVGLLRNAAAYERLNVAASRGISARFKVEPGGSSQLTPGEAY
jgi:hypothetical protein